MAEQGSEQGKEQITLQLPVYIRSQDNPNEHSSEKALREKQYAQGTKGPKTIPKNIKHSDPALTTRQVGEYSKTPPPQKEIYVKEIHKKT